jgi:hypothetical protein
MDKSGRFTPTSQLYLAFLNAIPDAQIPVALGAAPSDEATVLRLDIADQVESASADGVLGRCTLGLLFDDLKDGDEIEVSINGVALAWDGGERSADGWDRVGYEEGWSTYPSRTKGENTPGQSVEFDLAAPPLRHGENEISLRLSGHDPERGDGPVLKDVRVWVRYE